VRTFFFSSNFPSPPPPPCWRWPPSFGLSMGRRQISPSGYFSEIILVVTNVSMLRNSKTQRRPARVVLYFLAKIFFYSVSSRSDKYTNSCRAALLFLSIMQTLIYFSFVFGKYIFVLVYCASVWFIRRCSNCIISRYTLLNTRLGRPKAGFDPLARRKIS
jgi:hypothetical protein